MTARELATLLDKSAEITEGPFTYAVRILDARESYGRTYVLVTPAMGTGEAWVLGDRVRITGEGES